MYARCCGPCHPIRNMTINQYSKFSEEQILSRVNAYSGYYRIPLDTFKTCNHSSNHAKLWFVNFLGAVGSPWPCPLEQQQVSVCAHAVDSVICQIPCLQSVHPTPCISILAADMRWASVTLGVRSVSRPRTWTTMSHGAHSMAAGTCFMALALRKHWPVHRRASNAHTVG